MPPGDPQCLSCQGYVFSLPVMAEGIQASLEVMLVPCTCQKWWACGRIPTPGKTKNMVSLNLPLKDRTLISILQIEKLNLQAGICPEPMAHLNLGGESLWAGKG